MADKFLKYNDRKIQLLCEQWKAENGDLVNLKQTRTDMACINLK